MEQPGSALAGAGPNVRPGRGALLSSDCMTSLYSINRVTIADVKHSHENWARLLTLDDRGNSLVLTRAFFVNNEIYMAVLLNSQAQGVSGKNEHSYPNTTARGRMQLHRLHRLKAGPGNNNVRYKKIRKLEIRFVPKCRWKNGNLPVRGTWWTGTKDHCMKMSSLRISNQRRVAIVL